MVTFVIVMINYIKIGYLIGSIILISACSATKKTYIAAGNTNGLNLKLSEGDKVETLFLIGDTGTDKNYEDSQVYLFEHLKQSLIKAGSQASIVFLGDNIYPAGLPGEKEPNRKTAEKKLNTQLDVLNDLSCKTYFIPGNHDWNRMTANGLPAVKRQELYIESYEAESNINFYPNNGCGDPVIEKITDNLYYVFIDTQWWLQNWEKEIHINEGCNIQSREALLNKLENIFKEHENNQLVVFMHHPLYSNGEHGGRFSISDHFFPLRMFNNKLWIPLPILGSVQPVVRSLGGIKQDIPHPLYQELKNGILNILSEDQQVIFAAGHDHNLQYFNTGKQHFLVSGAGSKTDFVKAGGDAQMVRSAMGYAVVHFYKDGTAWLDFFMINKDEANVELIYRKQIVD